MGLAAACSGEVNLQTGGSTGAGAGEAGGGTPVECAGATPVLASDGTNSGFARCPDGTVHRVAATACNPSTGVTACMGNEMMVTCKSDAECTAKPHGRCGDHMVSTFGGNVTACDCIYPCANDAECGSGEVCVCAGVVPADQPFSYCAPAACVTGAGCPSGECGISSYDNGCGIEVALECRAPTDMCRTDAQCNSMLGQHCVLSQFSSPPNTWQCMGTNCAIGRPFVVEGEARTAAPVDRADWIAADLTVAPGALDTAARESIAAHWLEVAALEHASVGSFARFTLELLALGAPAHLVADAQRAALDEIEHARIAYAIASTYAGRAFGPGPIALGAASLETDPRAILRALIAEGCVGETLGAAEALALAGVAADPSLRAVFTRIAADEQRHAELAWRTLAWMISRGGEDMAHLAARCFEEAIAAAGHDPSPRPFRAVDHGVAPAEMLGEIRRRALAEVVSPCARSAVDLLPRRSDMMTPATQQGRA